MSIYTPIKRALLSVADKTGILEFAKALHAQGVEIISTGGTANLLTENNIPVIEVADYTGFPEILDGRVKTLHPAIHGGILARRGQDEATLNKHQIKPIDLVVVNLYPFVKTVADPLCDLATAIENIDIGGVTLLRAAAKNHAFVTVATQPQDYEKIITELKQQSGISTATRFNLAKKAFAHTAHYDGSISNYLSALQENGERSEFPETYNLQFQKSTDLRYGENPHQNAAFYKDPHAALDSAISQTTIVQGKALSYNNIADADAALECVKAFLGTPACVIVKHANPCGVAIASTQLQAYEQAYATDPTSAFGGIIAFNEPLTANTAANILARQFVEVIIAPEIEPAALPILATKPNIRVLTCGALNAKSSIGFDYKRVNGGLLIQNWDQGQVAIKDFQIVSKRQPTQQELQDLHFASLVAKYVKSNAIVYARNNTSIGIGAGQMSRVYSAKIAGMKATDEGLIVAGAVMASDAFFPFRDAIDAAAQAGITAIIQPGGSIRDEEVIAAADEHNIAMVLTHMRHFRH